MEDKDKIIAGMHNSASNRFDKIYQTLQEIKEIAEREFNKKLKDKDCFECDASFNKILQKISEVME